MSIAVFVCDAELTAGVEGAVALEGRVGSGLLVVLGLGFGVWALGRAMARMFSRRVIRVVVV